jgi:hypothetical protein
MHNARTPVAARSVMSKAHAGTLVAADIEAAQKVAAAQARRARRNAKRLADAEALAATASAAATPWPNPPYVAGQTFFDGHIDWTFYERRQEWIGVTRTKQARRNAKRAREAAKVGA